MRLPFSLLPLARGVADLLPRDPGLLDPEAIMASASGGRRPGEFAEDLAGEGAEPALRALVRAYDEEAGLTALGRRAARWDIERCLTNLRRLRAEETRQPAILGERIEAPLFIMGLPRSANTFLHSLLAEDPANQVLRCWQSIYPYSLGDGGSGGDIRPKRVDRQLRIFSLLTPEIRSVHPMDAWSPQECTEITAQVFRSARFDSTHHVPSYRRWLAEHGHLPAYRFHKRFLQHLQHQDSEERESGGQSPARRRWILKSPDHIFAFDMVREVYPDARIVFMHRDPVKVLASVARLTEILRMPFTERIDRQRIGAQTIADWTMGAAKMVEVSRDGRLPAPILHLHYREVVAQPLEAIRRLYRHFDMRLGEAAVGRMSRWIAAKPDGGYGQNVYSPDEYGIAPDDVRQRFRHYMTHFGVAEEAADTAAAALRSTQNSTLRFRSPRQA